MREFSCGILTHAKDDAALSHQARFSLILAFSLGEKEFLWPIRGGTDISL